VNLFLQLEINLDAAIAGFAARARLVVGRSLGTAGGHLDLIFFEAKPS
jgi:hypothetical protein